MTVRTWRWDGTATALSSIAHGGDTNGTITQFRRERFVQPDGTLEDVPVVSGNALRGLLRDTAADLFWEVLGRPDLPLPVAHALWGGGALVKSKGQPLTGGRLAELRRLCPVVGVFGAAGGGRIIGGCLQVGKLVPVCQETRHVLPPALQAGTLPSMWDLTQVEEFTRLPGGGPVRADKDPDGGSDLDGLMRFGAETLPAGTRFHTWLALANATPVERDFVQAVLDRYVAQGARVGGRAGSGHGGLVFDLTRTVLGGPEPDPTRWQAAPEADVAATLAAVRGLA